MQNLADSLTSVTSKPLAGAAAASAAVGSSPGKQQEDELSTFMVYNMRRKVRCGS